MKKFLLASLGLLLFCAAPGQTNNNFKRTEDIIYGRKFGTALTLDVFQPGKTNGLGIILMV